MKKFHPFYTTGTVGMIVTAILHMFLTLGLSLSVHHAVFFTLYPVYLAFIVLGLVFTVKSQKTTSNSIQH